MKPLILVACLALSLFSLASPLVAVSCPNCAGTGLTDIETNATWLGEHPDPAWRKPKAWSGGGDGCIRCRSTGKLRLANRLRHFACCGLE